MFALVNTEVFRRHDMKDGFTSKFDINANFYTGNSEYSDMSGKLRTDYFSEENQGFAVINLQQKTRDDGRFVNKGFGHIRGILKDTDVASTEVFVQKEFDEFLLLRSRLVFGGGRRYKHMNTDTFKSHYAMGAIWEEEVIRDSDDKTLVRASTYYTLTYTKPGAYVLRSTSYFQPHLGRLNDFRFLTDTSLNIAITKSIDFVTTLRMRYDSMPPNDLHEADIELTNGLSFKFDIETNRPKPISKPVDDVDPVSDETEILVPVPIDDQGSPKPIKFPGNLNDGTNGTKPDDTIGSPG
jgi:putative salt-induced outer membrane protein YdiY